MSARRDWFAAHAAGLPDQSGAAYAAAFNSDPYPAAGDHLAWAKWIAKADATIRFIQADAMIEVGGET